MLLLLKGDAIGKMKITIEKINRKIRSIWVSKLRYKKIYKYCYKSYWYCLFKRNYVGRKENLYFSARPNPGAGIGHQMANWIAGYWFAKQFKLKFAHIPFSSEKWERFLGFYQNEETINNLINKGYRLVKLQCFDENNKKMSYIKSINFI